MKDNKGSSAASPALPSGHSTDSSRADFSQELNKSATSATTPGINLQHSQLEKARSLSASGTSPSPSLAGAGRIGDAQPLPGMAPKANGSGFVPNGVPPPTQPLRQATPLQNGHAPPAAPAIYDKKVRAPGRGVCILTTYLY